MKLTADQIATLSSMVHTALGVADEDEVMELERLQAALAGEDMSESEADKTPENELGIRVYFESNGIWYWSSTGGHSKCIPVGDDEFELGCEIDVWLDSEVNPKLPAGEKVSRAFSVRYVEHMDQVAGVMCLVVFKLKGAITVVEMQDLCGRLYQFTGMPGDPSDGPEISGYKWFLGDGDDMSAVKFKNGEIQIWLRGWK